MGMTFRHVPASEGDAVHVSIETITPNSPAAQADLQKGDRLIAIGGETQRQLPVYTSFGESGLTVFLNNIFKKLNNAKMIC